MELIFVPDTGQQVRNVAQCGGAAAGPGRARDDEDARLGAGAAGPTAPVAEVILRLIVEGGVTETVRATNILYSLNIFTTTLLMYIIAEYSHKFSF